MRSRGSTLRMLKIRSPVRASPIAKVAAQSYRSVFVVCIVGIALRERKPNTHLAPEVRLCIGLTIRMNQNNR